MSKIIDILWNFLKKISLRIWLEIIIGAVLLIGLCCYYNSYKTTKNELEITENNNKAYQARLESASNEIIQFKFTVEQLKYFNDSISVKLVNTMKELKISEKNLREANYMLSHFSRTDTVYCTDTIFKEPDFVLDTTVGDEWMNTKLYLEYPNKIGVKSKAKSEKEVFIYTKKETVDPPKKFFLCRWFQKKHTVTEVKIKENNPNIESEQNVFIKTDD